jgi:hypothetical protein
LLAGQTGEEADEHAIRAVIDRFMDAWNRHDAKSFAAVFCRGRRFHQCSWRRGDWSREY